MKMPKQCSSALCMLSPCFRWLCLPVLDSKHSSVGRWSLESGIFLEFCQVSLTWCSSWISNIHMWPICHPMNIYHWEQREQSTAYTQQNRFSTDKLDCIKVYCNNSYTRMKAQFYACAHLHGEHLFYHPASQSVGEPHSLCLQGCHSSHNSPTFPASLRSTEHSKYNSKVLINL